MATSGTVLPCDEWVNEAGLTMARPAISRAGRRASRTARRKVLAKRLPMPPHECPVGADAYCRRTRAARGLHPRTEATELADSLDKVLADNGVGVGKAWHAAGHVAIAQHVGEQLHAVGAKRLSAEDRRPARNRDMVADRQLAELAPSVDREERMGEGGLDLTP